MLRQAATVAVRRVFASATPSRAMSAAAAQPIEKPEIKHTGVRLQIRWFLKKFLLLADHISTKILFIAFYQQRVCAFNVW